MHRGEIGDELEAIAPGEIFGRAVEAGAQGLLDPATYTETFGIAVDGAAANTVRADLSAFFLVAAGSAAIGALVRGWTGALLVLPLPVSALSTSSKAIACRLPNLRCALPWKGLVNRTSSSSRMPLARLPAMHRCRWLTECMFGW